VVKAHNVNTTRSINAESKFVIHFKSAAQEKFQPTKHPTRYWASMFQSIYVGLATRRYYVVNNMFIATSLQENNYKFGEDFPCQIICIL
jgi:hypothetical protein